MAEDNKEFIVEVSISLPQGENLDDWKFVGKLSETVNEETVSYDSSSIGRLIAQKVGAFLSNESQQN